MPDAKRDVHFSSVMTTICLFNFVLFLCLPVSAGQVKISGIVTDRRGLPVGNVWVDAVKKTGSPASRWAITDSTGYYEMSVPTQVEIIENQIPAEFSLSQNYPNPFNPSTCFNYSIKEACHVRIDLFDLIGRHIKTLNDEECGPGTYQAEWDGTDDHHMPTAGGIYIARMTAPNFRTTKKWIKTDGGPFSSIVISAIHSYANVDNTEEKNLTDLFDFTFRNNEIIGKLTVTDFVVEDRDTTLDVTVSRIPVYIQWENPIVTFPNRTVIVDNNGNISDPDDDLENLVITSVDSDVAEVRGINGNTQLEIKLIENFEGNRDIFIRISDGQVYIEDLIMFFVEGTTLSSKAVDWETGEAVNDSLYIFAVNCDTINQEQYLVITQNGDIRISVKPGIYDLYIRDELDHFAIEPYYLHPHEEIVERLQNEKPEWLKIGRWYDRIVKDIDLNRDILLPDQKMIRENIDLHDHGQYIANYGTIPSRFDYAGYFWMRAGYKRWQFGPGGGVVPDDFSYRNTGQEIPELQGQGGRWEPLLLGQKLYINVNRSSDGLGVSTISPFSDETNNQHAVDTYLEAQEEFFLGLNPDWFDFQNDTLSSLFLWYADWGTTPADDQTVYQPNGLDFRVKKLVINNQIAHKYTFSQVEDAKKEIKRHLMSCIMDIMGIEGHFVGWPFYQNVYIGNIDHTVAETINRATAKRAPSEWDMRDVRNILYYYSIIDTNPTDVLID